MKQLKDYLHLYLGCMVQYKRFNEELQMYVLINPRVLNADCLLTINMLYGEYSLIDVVLHLRPQTNMTDKEKRLSPKAELDKWGNVTIESMAKLINYCRKLRIDVDGLIESGLAIDKTLLTLPV